jgi:hypothetical protein
MNYRRGLGIGLVFIGLILALTGNVITGAVIGTDPEHYLGIFGLLVFIGGVLLIVASAHEKNIFRLPGDLETLVNDSGIGASKEKTTVLVDTQFLKRAQELSEREIDTLLNDMSKYNVIVLPQVLKECVRQKVPRSFVNRFKQISSRDYSALTHDETDALTEAYAFARRGDESNKKRYKGSSYKDETKRLMDGADAQLLAYGLRHKDEPVLILSDDRHIKMMAPYLNDSDNTWMSVIGLDHYLREAA